MVKKRIYPTGQMLENLVPSWSCSLVRLRKQSFIRNFIPQGILSVFILSCNFQLGYSASHLGFSIWIFGFMFWLPYLSVAMTLHQDGPLFLSHQKPKHTLPSLSPLWLSFIITAMGRFLNSAHVYTHMLNLILLNPNCMQFRVRKTHRLKIKTPFNLTFVQNLIYFF